MTHREASHLIHSLKPFLKIAFFLLDGVSKRIFNFSFDGSFKFSTVHSNDKRNGLVDSFTRPIIWPRNIFNSSLFSVFDTMSNRARVDGQMKIDAPLIIDIIESLRRF